MICLRFPARTTAALRAGRIFDTPSRAACIGIVARDGRESPLKYTRPRRTY